MGIELDQALSETLADALADALARMILSAAGWRGVFAEDGNE